MGQFDGKVAVVTGGAMGIGGASARMLAGEGAKVLVADIDMDAAQANATRIVDAGGEAEAMQVDVSQMDQVEAMVARAADRFGGLHFVVNNAWGRKEPDGTAETLTESGWDFGMDAMVKAHFIAVKHAVPVMRKSGGGAVVNIASVHGFLMCPSRLSYEAAKSSVIGITKQMAIDFGPDGIRVNAICPGLILTEKSAPRFEQNPRMHELLSEQYPVRRTGVPDDIANAVVYLCSEDASFVTGHALVVDGGLSIQLQENLGFAQARFAQAHADLEF